MLRDDTNHHGHQMTRSMDGFITPPASWSPDDQMNEWSKTPTSMTSTTTTQIWCWIRDMPHGMSNLAPRWSWLFSVYGLGLDSGHASYPIPHTLTVVSQTALTVDGMCWIQDMPGVMITTMANGPDLISRSEVQMSRSRGRIGFGT